MRLIAIPLARVRPGAHPVSTFLSQQTKIAHAAGAAANDPSNKPPLSTRILTKASDFWMALSKDGEDGKKVAIFDWKRRTYTFGEKLMDRIEYEEWALKAVDPSLDPGYTKSSRTASTGQSQSQPPLPTIRMHYPPSLLDPNYLRLNLSNLVAARTPHHRSRMIWCCVGMPLTIPFALLPIVPNLPFFYLVWRAWSHLRAYRSSQYLAALILQNRIAFHSDPDIDVVFKGYPSSTSDQLILTPERIEQLKEALDLNQQSTNELTRARQQTQASIDNGDLSKLEQAAEGQSREARDDNKKKQ